MNTFYVSQRIYNEGQGQAQCGSCTITYNIFLYTVYSIYLGNYHQINQYTSYLHVDVLIVLYTLCHYMEFTEIKNQITVINKQPILSLH